MGKPKLTELEIELCKDIRLLNHIIRSNPKDFDFEETLRARLIAVKAENLLKSQGILTWLTNY